MVASDRLSRVRRRDGRADSGQGRVLTQMALFWFAKLGHIVPNHLTGDDPLSVVSDERTRAGARPLDARASG